MRLLLLLVTSGVAQAAPLMVGSVPGLDPAELRITTFATGIGPIYGMARDNGGALLVGVSGQPFFGGLPGQVLRFVDNNFDGVADGGGTAVVSGIPGVVTAVQRVGDLLAVGTLSEASVSSRVGFYAPGATPDAPYTQVGELNFAFGQFWEHASPGIAARPTPGLPGSYDVFVNVGSQANNAASGPLAVSGLGLSNAPIPGDSIFMFRVNTSGGSAVSEPPVQIVSGIRNAVAMGFHPVTGDFYFADNGIDGSPDINEPLSADELNRIPVGSLGSGPFNFGFSSSYVTYRSGVVVGGGIQPSVVFQPLGDPLTGSESEGPAGLAFSPSGFPAALSGGIFVGFHGKSVPGPGNEENPVVYVDLGTGDYYHFISNDDPNVGAIDSLLATNDSLFLGDLATGTIYQVSSIPEPATWGLMASAISLLLLLARRR